MNQEYEELFGHLEPLIPLKETGAIVCDNATRADWNEVCEARAKTYICGNPPYLGSKQLDDSHQSDFDAYFDGQKYPKEMDYISLWFLKAADWIGDVGEAAFVSTNSVTQGQHVAMLWPKIFEKSSAISFAYTSFLWGNNAVGNAGVTCVVIGLCPKDSNRTRLLFSEDSVREVAHINPYLVPSEDNTTVGKASQPLAIRPKMTFGSKAIDGGHLVLNADEREQLLAAPEVSPTVVRPFIGAKELLRAEQRYCLWLDADSAESAMKNPLVEARVDRVETFRLSSSNRQTIAAAETPHALAVITHQDLPCIAVPRHSSERRSFVPMGFYPAGTVISDANFAVYGASPWLLALLQSSMHMTWVRSVGGRMKSDYRYSNTLCYNTFPFPEIGDQTRAEMEVQGLSLLAARERWPDRSLAELYDPDKMPANLREAHEANDALVDSLYRTKPFGSDTDRMEMLLAMYRDLVAEADAVKSKKSTKKGGK